MSGYVDLHCHYVPGVDDGVRTLDESRRLLVGLRALGWERVVATPHVRTAMFENRAPGLRAAFASARAELERGADTLPELGLAAEHYFDDVFWGLFVAGEALPYPGGHAALVEFHYEIWPRGAAARFFDMQLRGVRPVIEHPERYHALFRATDSLDPLLDAGAVTLLDVMSLVGRYGDHPRRAAERMLEEGAYDAACTDSHKPEDLVSTPWWVRPRRRCCSASTPERSSREPTIPDVSGGMALGPRPRPRTRLSIAAHLPRDLLSMTTASPERELPQRPEGPSVLRGLLPKLAISIALGALFVWLVQRGGVPLIPPRGAFDSVRWWTLGAYALLLLSTHFFRASRWRFLIAPVKQVPLLEGVFLNWIGFFAIFALPLRLGEMARPALTKIRHGIPISVGLGTVAVERVIDGLVTSLCVVWAIVVLPRRPTDDPIAQAVPFYGGLAVAVFSAALVGLCIFLWQRRIAVRLVDWTFGLVSARLASTVAEKVGSIAEGVKSIAVPRLAFGFLAETLIYWTLNAFGMWLLAWGCGLELGFGHAVAIMGILAIGILLPAGPGLFGNFQLAISVALKLYLAEQIVGTQGAVYIFLLYAVQAVLITITGVVPLYAMHLRFSDLLRTDSSS